jgi:hypothetical protein
MPEGRKFELDELAIRPGTYFHPQTEILVVVDDSPVLDPELFDKEDHEGAEWVLIADEVPVDEHRRDELLEAFQVDQQPLAHSDDEEDADAGEEDLDADPEE